MSIVRVVLVYALFGGAWVILSDWALVTAGGPTVASGWVQTVKGTLFVVLSALLLFGLLRWEWAKRAKVESLLTTVFQASPHAISISTMADGRYLDVNPAFAEISGYGRDEIIDRTSEELGLWVNPADRQDLVNRLQDDGYVRNMEFEMRAKGGPTETGLLSAERVEIEDEPCILAITTIITDWREAERRTHQQDVYHRALLENALDITSVLEADGTIRYESPSIERVLGHQPSDLVGENAFDYIHPDDVQEVVRVFSQGVGVSGYMGTIEFRFRHKDGS